MLHCAHVCSTRHILTRPSSPAEARRSGCLGCHRTQFTSNECAAAQSTASRQLAIDRSEADSAPSTSISAPLAPSNTSASCANTLIALDPSAVTSRPLGDQSTLKTGLLWYPVSADSSLNSGCRPEKAQRHRRTVLSSLQDAIRLPLPGSNAIAHTCVHQITESY